MKTIFILTLGFLMLAIGIASAQVIDIKPGSCPNALNIDSMGILTVAVLGTEDFDATTVDPASIRLQGVAPIRSSVEDLASPVIAQ